MKGRIIAYSGTELALVEALQEVPRAMIHAEFVEMFDRDDVTEDNIKSLCTRRGWCRRIAWTSTQDDTIRAHYADMSNAELAKLVNRPVVDLYHRASALGCCKSARFMASPASGRCRQGDRRGAAAWFKKGRRPTNKGKRSPGSSTGRMGETQFVKGGKTWNWKPIGSIRIVGGFHYTKVSDLPGVVYTVNWKATHILRWEAIRGPIPEGHVLKSLDSDRSNLDPANWMLVSRSVLPRLNGGRLGRIGYDNAPVEMKPTIMVVAQLEHAVRKHRRRARDVANPTL